MRRKKENEPRQKLGDKIFNGISTTVELVITVINPITYVVLLRLGVKEGLNALDDSITTEENMRNNSNNQQQGNPSPINAPVVPLINPDEGSRGNDNPPPPPLRNVPVASLIDLDYEDTSNARFMTQEEIAQIQADHDLAVRLAGERD